jgi:hypothetical protein
MRSLLTAADWESVPRMGGSLFWSAPQHGQTSLLPLQTERAQFTVRVFLTLCSLLRVIHNPGFPICFGPSSVESCARLGPFPAIT